MYEAAASCKDISRASVTNWEPPDLTLARYYYAARHGMEVQIATQYCGSPLQRYGVTECGDVTSEYPSWWHIFVVTRFSAREEGVMQLGQVD
jgi:hypothetical protein